MTVCSSRAAGLDPEPVRPVHLPSGPAGTPLVRRPAGGRDRRRHPRHASATRAARARSGARRRGRDLGGAVRRRGSAPLPRRHRLVGVLGAPERHPADPAGRPRHLRRDSRRRHRCHHRCAPLRRPAARDPGLHGARRRRSPRPSGASATTPIRSSSAGRRTCPGVSRSTRPTDRPSTWKTRPSTRRSCTRRSGA